MPGFTNVQGRIHRDLFFFTKWKFWTWRRVLPVYRYLIRHNTKFWCDFNTFHFNLKLFWCLLSDCFFSNNQFFTVYINWFLRCCGLLFRHFFRNVSLQKCSGFCLVFCLLACLLLALYRKWCKALFRVCVYALYSIVPTNFLFQFFPILVELSKSAQIVSGISTGTHQTS